MIAQASSGSSEPLRGAHVTDVAAGRCTREASTVHGYVGGQPFFEGVVEVPVIPSAGASVSRIMVDPCPRTRAHTTRFRIVDQLAMR